MASANFAPFKPWLSVEAAVFQACVGVLGFGVLGFGAGAGVYVAEAAKPGHYYSSTTVV